MLKIIKFRSLLTRYTPCTFYSTQSSATVINSVPKKVQVFIKEYDYFHTNKKYPTFEKHDSRFFSFHDKDIIWVPDKVSTFKMNNNNRSGQAEHINLINKFHETLKQLEANNTSITSPELNDFIDEFTDKLQKFGPNELLTALQIFARFHWEDFTHQTPNFVELFMAFDQMCAKNAVHWDFDQLLLVCDLWTIIPTAQRSMFITIAVNTFNRRLKYLTTPQLIQAIHYMNILDRRILEIRGFELKFLQIVDTLTLEELSIVCKLFSKVGSIQNTELTEKILKFLLENNITGLDDKFLVGIIKLLESSIREAHCKYWEIILERFVEHIDTKTLRTCCLLLSVGISHRIYNDKLTQRVYQRILDSDEGLGSLRHNEITQIADVLGTFTTATPNGNEIIIAERILKSLENLIHLSLYTGIHRNMVTIMCHLLRLGIYNMELIDNILRPDYIKLLYGRNKVLPVEIFLINGFTQINLKNIYSGNRLDKSYTQIMGKYMTDFIPDRNDSKRSRHTDFILSIEYCVEKLYKHYRYANAVSHYKNADIFLCYDKTTKEFIDISDKFPPHYTGDVISRDCIVGDSASNLEIIAFIAAPKRMFWNDKTEYVGYFRQKIEQLKLLGFHPIVVSWSDCNPLMRSGDASEIFIKEKVDAIIRNFD